VINNLKKAPFNWKSDYTTEKES